MTKDYYTLLGLEKTATAEDIKKAYRKLANQHHPDKGGDEEKFKEIKEAYEVLSDPNRRQAHDNPTHDFHDLNDLMQQMRAAHRGMNIVHEFVANVPIREAFKGFTMKVRVAEKMDEVQIPAGVPNLARGQYITAGGTKVIVTVRFADAQFRVRSINEASQQVSADGRSFTGRLDTGDTEIDVKIDALDLLLGVWIDVEDLLGEKYAVRVPSGFNLQHRLKVKGKGYLCWSVAKDQADGRGDLLIRLIPEFKPLRSLDAAKVKALYDATKPAEPAEPAEPQEPSSAT